MEQPSRMDHVHAIQGFCSKINVYPNVLQDIIHGKDPARNVYLLAKLA